MNWTNLFNMIDAAGWLIFFNVTLCCGLLFKMWGERWDAYERSLLTCACDQAKKTKRKISKSAKMIAKNRRKPRYHL